MRGHNVVADGWVGESNPYAHFNTHPTLKHTHNIHKTLVFHFFTQSSWTYRRTNWQTKSPRTSDAGLQYCCGWVGRGIQPPFTSHAPLPDTHIQVQKAYWLRATVTLEKLNFELLKKLRNELFELVTKPESNFLLKKLNSELFFLYLFILAYFLKTCKGFDNLNGFLAPKSIHEWKIRKIEGCHVCDFNL